MMRRWLQLTAQVTRARPAVPAGLGRCRGQHTQHGGGDVRDDGGHAFLQPYLADVRASLLSLLGSAHPGLQHIADYYFLHPSKQIRPLLVLLFAAATNGLAARYPHKHWAAAPDASRHPPPALPPSDALDRPLSRPDVLCDYNPRIPHHTVPFQPTFPHHPPPPAPPPPSPPPAPYPHHAPCAPLTVLPTQLRLAQIVEMIHVASLLHDDVIDASPLRRGAPSAPSAFGNKLTILGGDFLLGRASVALSRLGEPEVVELIATVIANLVEGEILQMGTPDPAVPRLSPDPPVAPSPFAPPDSPMSVYLTKTYLKTASLMAKGARAAVVLGGAVDGEPWKDIAYTYGRNLGIAFQLVDDILDYSPPSSASARLGKPADNADLKLGLATGPALFAAEEHPQMWDMIGRRFERDGDVETARALVASSRGLARTLALAEQHAVAARDALQALPASEARDALEELTERVVRRRW